MSPVQEQEIVQQAEKMVRDGIARPSSSPWAHNVILLKKKDGCTRFVVDYRPLNDVTVKDAYPMPDVREIVDKMCEAKFTKLDMAGAYWAVPIKENDRHKTAFTTPRGLLEMCVTGYGLCNSQATYQRIIDETTKDVENTESFVDDVISHTVTFQKHLVILRQYLMKLREANLQLRTDKCKFGYSEVDFVGLHVSEKGVSPIPTSINPIEEFPVPVNRKELERFLGMCGYYRQFIPHMADISEPLNHLKRQGQPFVWTKECDVAFTSLKQKLVSPPILVYPQWDQPFYVEADFSEWAVRGTLAQKYQSGMLKPIGYMSNVLDDSQHNYGPGEGECFAIIANSRKWRPYLRAATKVIFITDHEPLKWLRQQKDPRAKYARWIMELEELHYEIIARTGLDHVVPDCLSRVKLTQDSEMINDNKFNDKIFSVQLDQMNMEDITIEMKAHQDDDPAIRYALQQLEDAGEIRKGRYKRYNRMKVKDGILMRGEQVVVPNTLRFSVTDIVHRECGHLGTDGTCEWIARKYMWAGMRNFVADFCAHCKICIENKPSRFPQDTISWFC